MEFGHPYLQFAFNVVAITGVTSLSVMFTLFKRDEAASVAEPKERPARGGNQTRPVARATRGFHGIAVPSSPVKRQDIREFVSHRIDRWAARSESVRAA